MFYFLSALIAAAFVIIQLLIGGTRLVFSIPAYAVLVLAGLLSLALITRPRLPANRACLVASTIFFSYIIARICFSPVPALARPELYMVLAGLLIYSLTAIYLTSARSRLLLLLVLGAMVWAQDWVGLKQFTEVNNWLPFGFLRADYGWRASGFYICPDHFAGFVEVLAVFCFSICFWSRWNWILKTFFALTGVAAIGGLAISGSRGGYLSLTFSLAIFVVISLLLVMRLRPARFKMAVSGIIAFAVVMGVGLSILISQSSSVLTRVKNIPDWNNMRLMLWDAAMKQFHTAPLFGTGSGTYLFFGRLFRNPTMQMDPVYVHNDYLELLSEFGIIAAILFLLFLFIHLGFGIWTQLRLARAHRIKEDDRAANALALNIGALCAVAAYMVHSVVDFNLHIPANVMLMGFMFGILANPGVKCLRDEEMQRFSGWRLVIPALAIALGLLALPRFRGEYYAENARVALRNHHYIRAIGFANKGIASEDDNPYLYYYLGEAQRILGARSQNGAVRKSFSTAAVSAFKKAYILFPQDERTLVMMALTDDALGNFDEAEDFFQKALRWDPNLASIYAYYGWHYQIQGKTKRAREMFKKSLSLEHNKAAVRGMKASLDSAKPALPKKQDHN